MNELYAKENQKIHMTDLLYAYERKGMLLAIYRDQYQNPVRTYWQLVGQFMLPSRGSEKTPVIMD